MRNQFKRSRKSAGRREETMNKNRTQVRLAALVVLALLYVAGAASIATAQTAPIDGVMMLQNLTAPSGGIWLPTASGGGHWWQTDSALGICRMDPLGAIWQLTNCAGAVKSGGQAIPAKIGPGYPTAGLPSGAKFVFVPDNS